MAATSSPAETPRIDNPLPGHPILGHLGWFRNDRVGMLLRLAENDLVAMRMGFVRRVVVISSPALVQEVLVAEAASFAKAPGLGIFLRPVLGDGLLTSEREVHARQRRLLAPAFAPKRIASYAATMSERADRFAAAQVDGASVDVADLMMRLTFDIVGKALFDAEVASEASVVGAALTVAMETAFGQLGSLVPVPPSIPTPQNLRYRRAVRRLDEVVYRVIEERRAGGDDRGDVLSVLLAARDEDGAAMDDRQIRDEVMTLFLAGHETTANALAWAFYLLGRSPAARERLEAEARALGRPPTYEDLRSLPWALAVLKEAMRLYPPAYMIGRRAARDVTIGEHRIARGTIVILNVIGIHRRPELYPDPDRFDPERFLGDAERALPRCGYMPFGAGPRICIGNHFALMEGQVLLAALARRLRFETSTADAEPEPLVTLRPRGGVAARVRVTG